MEVKVIKTNNKHNSIQNKKLNNKGFSLVAVMVASVLGLIVFSGITTMQVTTMKSLNKAELRFNTLEVTKDILNTLRTPFPDPCSAPNCKTGCTNTLFGKLATTTADVDITTIKSHSDTTPTPDISAQTDFEVKDPIEELPDYKKILLDSIKFEGKGDKGTLKISYRLESANGFKIPIPSPLNIKILTVDDKGTTADTTDDTIKTCEVVSLGGVGGEGANCYEVNDQGKTIVGCDADGNTTGASAPNASTFFGHDSGKVTTATENTFIGYKAGTLNNTGYSNTFVGHEAGRKVSGANHWNAYFGSLAGADATGNHNTYIGSHSGYGSTADTDNTGSNNTFVGINSGRFNTTGYDNTYIGSHAGYLNTEGDFSVFIGRDAGRENTTGDSNIFIGRSAGYYNKTGGSNIVVGFSAGGYATGGSNIFIGHQAGQGQSSTTKNTASSNIFIGYQAGYENTEGYYNTFLGYQAGQSNTTGNRNIFLGYRAGYKNTEGIYNTFLGYNAGHSNTEGIYNTFLGYNAGYENTEGEYNTFLGVNAGYENTEGYYNTFLGFNAGRYATGGSNIFIGHQAGQGQSSTTKNTAYSNTFIGYQTGYENTEGNYNTFLGNRAGHSNTTGKYNTFLGFWAGKSNTTGKLNIYIGYNTGSVGSLEKDRSNQLQIGKWILGVVDSSSKLKALHFLFASDSDKTSDAKVVIQGDLEVRGKIKARGTIETDPTLPLPSSRVYKQNITPFEDYESSLGVIMDTPLFNYQYKKNYIFYDTEVGHTRMGVISEELPVGLQIKEKGKPSVPDWVSVYGTLWAGIKALFGRVTSTDKKVEELERRVEEVEKLKKEIQILRRELSL